MNKYRINLLFKKILKNINNIIKWVVLKKKKEDGNRLKAASDESYGLVLHDGDYTTLVSPESEKSFNGKVNVYDATGRAIRLNVDKEKSFEQ